MAQFNWVSSSRFSGVPSGAVFAGSDTDGSAIYVGRAHHEGDLLPAKVIPSKQVAYVCYNCNEIMKDNFEVLVGQNFTWIPASGGNVPPNAVMSGHTSTGEPLYIGRGQFQGSLTPGKVHQSHGCLYLPFGGAERRIDHYEVLVSPDIWVSNEGRTVAPPNAVFAGQDTNGDAIYVGRAYHEFDLLPAKIIPSKGCAFVSYNGMEIQKFQYEILTGFGYTWVKAASGHVPPNTVTAGKTSSGETLYIGRGEYNGSLTPGKIHSSHRCLYIPYGGREVSLIAYEALVKN